MFGDPHQQQHMMAGVRAAHASPRTPAHLRPHLAQRLGGNMPVPPRKVIVGSTGHSPMKTVATARQSGMPIKTVVGSTARPPIKTTVGGTGGPPRKTLVGSLAAPPKKTTAANLGTGGNRPLGMAAADRGAINAANPRTVMRPLGRGDGNLGRSVAPMPKPPQGPPNPTMGWSQPWNVTDIEDGGMGPTAKRMGRAPSRGARPRRSNFFGE